MEAIAYVTIPVMGWLGLDPGLEEQKRFNRETAKIQKDAIEWEKRRQIAVEEEQRVSRQSSIGDRDLSRIFAKLGQRPRYVAPDSVISFAAVGTLIIGGTLIILFAP